MVRVFSSALILLIFKGFLCAQTGAGSEMTPEHVFRVDVVERVTAAINYGRLNGAARIDFRGTPLMPFARGDARVESKRGYMEIAADIRNLEPATEFGSEYLTYVLWAITPEGRAANLGEVLVRGNRSRLNVTAELQVFGLIVTAEPYFAVRQPSDLVVLENELREDTPGTVELIDARYELLERGRYRQLSNPLMLTLDPKVPIELYEARNAVQIARSSGAADYSSDTFLKAEQSLRQAEAYQARGEGERPVTMLARESVQRAEDAREIAVRRQEEEELERERQAAADREQAAREAAEEEARRRQEAEQRAAAEQIAREHAEQLAAERDELERELRQARDEVRDATERLQETLALLDERTAEFRSQRDRWEEERQNRETEEAERQKRLEDLDRAESRVQLQSRLNDVLAARVGEEGLVVEISPDLFAPGSAELTADGREHLAMASGVLLAYRDVRFRLRGMGAFGGELVSERAETVRAYLAERGLQEWPAPETTLTEKPAAAMDGAGDGEGSIELIVRGDAIGYPLGSVLEESGGF